MGVKQWRHIAQPAVTQIPSSPDISIKQIQQSYMLVGVARQILNTLEADSLNEVCCAVMMSVLATLRKMSSTKNYNFTQNGNKLIINAETI